MCMWMCISLHLEQKSPLLSLYKYNKIVGAPQELC